MDECARSFVGLNANMKQTREEVNELKSRIINDMVSTGQNNIRVADDKIINLKSKTTRKNVSAKKVLQLAAEKFGTEISSQLKEMVESSMGAPTVKHTIEIVDA